MAIILDAFAVKMIDRLGDLLEEKVVTILGVKGELKRLQRRMGWIKNLLQDAERKRMQSIATEAWVRELKDVMYDADDIIDLCRFEDVGLLDDQPSAPSGPPSLRCNFPSLFSYFSSVHRRHEISNKIKNLNERLDAISKGKSELNLEQNAPDILVTRVNYRQTSAIVDPAGLVGRDIERATTELVELIVRKDERKCPVFAITGMGGIGKTTLAQNIFNHQNIQSEFSTMMWVCISQNYSETNLLKEIIRGAGGNHGDLQTKAELLPLLKIVVSDKPLFLVLDDVWRADVWIELLRNPLQSGSNSSRILVTTRDQNVAMQMGATYMYPVEQLPVESGWELLCKSVFVTGKEEMQNLRDVGIQIIEKCHGLPLAIKTIAGVLTTKERSKGEWEKILRRDTWSIDKLPDDLRGALYLSYEDLPSHLKQCFLYCSLFPEDTNFSRKDVVKFWVVEGFVETHEDSCLELADEYFEQLIRRNLIQKAYAMFYKMHDLLRSLVQFLAQDESFCGEAHELTTISTTRKLRRLTITDKEKLMAIHKPLIQQKNLRTIFLRRAGTHLLRSLGNDLFVRFPFLRFLLLSGSAIESVPDAVGKLIHLRLLDLERTTISSLPESIKHLKNLQVLNLSECKLLHTLPKGITRLSSLRCIELHNTPLHFIPVGIGRLEQLNVFEGFVVGSDEQKERGHNCTLEELESLLKLRKLSVFKLERVVVTQKGQAVLRNNPHLKHLELSCTASAYNTTVEYSEEIYKIEKIFAELTPPPCLERLQIEGYFGHAFPTWMMSSLLGTFLPQLRILYLCNCETVQQLPPLGLLPELRHLEIGNASGVVTIGNDFLGKGFTSVSFPKLEVLRIMWVQNLKEWSCGEEEELTVFPHLQKLNISGCPKLESLPRGLKQSPLKEFYIEYCQSLKTISDLPSLRLLKIEDCPSLKCVEKVDALGRLIMDVSECLPEWLLRLLQQRQHDSHEVDNFQLELGCDIHILNKCLMGCECWPIIENIPRVKVSQYHPGKGYLFYTKQPFDYNTNL